VGKVTAAECDARPAAAGAAPQGATDSASAARAVRGMFTAIAPRYDLANHLLSCNIDRLWWRRTARAFQAILVRPNARVLDLCCGTGDMTFALQKQAGKSSPTILGADFSHAMLERALKKSRAIPHGQDGEEHDFSRADELEKGQPLAPAPHWIEADALNLPFPSAHFDLVTSAFGFRNLADYDAGLREIARILRPGGECGILDFGEPDGVIGQMYRFYFKRILPAVGTMISGVRGPYEYLPASVARFPAPQEMLDRMRRAGFAEASWEPYTFGIAGLYRGKRL
jgi:demethylmenaquinone methyltransferase / 2-methoxy-6-polyprenyl-1,4-benzoquinol methylase